MLSPSSLLLGSVAALAVQAQVNNGPANLPINAQNGALHFPLACTFLGMNETFDGIFTGTGPVVAGPGQETYLTDATVQFTAPSSLSKLAGEAGVTQVSAFVKGNFSGINTANQIIPIFPHGLQLNNISIPASGGIKVAVPQHGGTLDPIGPVTLGNTAGRAVVYFHDLNILMNLYDKNGKVVFSNVSAVCAQPTPNIELFVISIHGAAGQAPLTISTGQAGVFPATPDNYEVGSFRFPYSCNITGFGTRAVDLALTGEVPTYLAPCSQFNITTGSAFLRLPDSLSNDLAKKYPSYKSFNTKVNSFYITTTNASPAKVNALAATGALTVQTGHNGSSLTAAIPADGNLPPIGPITAGKTVGQTVYIGTGDAVAELLVLDGKGKLIDTVPVACSPTIPVDFIGFPITNAQPPVYTG